MRSRLTVAVLVGLVAVGAIGGGATASADVRVALQQDCGSPCGQPVDSTGPIGFGFVNYNKNGKGDLRILAVLRRAAPNTTYLIYLVCGPRHSAACGNRYVEVGSLRTNLRGNGSS